MNFCTISTRSHLFKTYALAESLVRYGAKIHVLLVDGGIPDESVLPESTRVYSLEWLSNDRKAQEMITKYKRQTDKLRWGLKPVFMKALLVENDKVVYCDNDILFFNSPIEQLESLLAENDFILTPHFYKADPSRDQNWLEANFRVGLYNAGFVAASVKAVNILEWWTDACLYNIKKAFWRGLFDDQKYLDLVPILFDRVAVLKDTGWNLAGWNFEHRLRQKGEVDSHTVICIHFAALSMREFKQLEHPMHLFYKEYVGKLRKYKPDFIHRDEKWSLRSLNTFLYFLKWKLARTFD